MITIGIDPHKRTHTAVAIDEQRRPLGELEVAASARMSQALLDWAVACPSRCWAIEGSDGLGKLLAQQLLAAGDRRRVPASLAARARLLRTGHGRKTDGIDALSVAEIAATRDDLRRQVIADGDTAVLRLLADRRDALSRQRRQAINRLHRHLRDLIPGGAPTSLSADTASAALGRVRPATPVETERKHIARQLIVEIRRIDKQLTDNRARTRAAVETAPTRLTAIFGISHVVAAKILGHTGPIQRSPTADGHANYTGTAPIEVPSGDTVRHRLSRSGNRQLNNAIHLAAHVQRSHPGPGRDSYLRKIAEGKSKREAMRCLKRQIAKRVYRQLCADSETAHQTLLEAAA